MENATTLAEEATQEAQNVTLADTEEQNKNEDSEQEGGSLEESKTGESEAVSLAEYRKKNREAQSLRNKLKNAEAEHTEKLSQAEARIQELEEKLIEADFKRDALEYLSNPKVAARKPEQVLKLIDREALKFEGGKIHGLEAEIKRLKSEFGELFISGSQDGGAGNNSASTAIDMNALLRQKAGY